MLAVVIIVSVMFDLGDGGPVIEVMSGFAEGMIGGCRASKEVGEPWGHGLSDLFVEVVRSKE